MTVVRLASGMGSKTRRDRLSLMGSISELRRFYCQEHRCFSLSRLSLLKGKQSISFGYSFLKETGEGKIDKYGEETKLKFRETDLPSSP